MIEDTIMKRITALFLVLILCLSAAGPAAFAVSAVRTTYFEDDLAANLKNLGLFQGVSDTDFALDKAPTKAEALVMLIRLLGKEDQALSGGYTHPFTDVAPWADKYVAYAYQKGLVNGVSATRMGTGAVSACTYLTFVLRALGYSDTEGADFTWDNPFQLAESAGILSDSVSVKSFIRADVVLVSYSALGAQLKSKGQTLAEKLIGEGVFTQATFAENYDADAINTYDGSGALSAEEIYDRYASAVFKIITYDTKGTQLGNGSGFFIDSSGTAVTNYHVIDGAVSAKITLSDGIQVCDVAGVYDYSEDEDWAVIKIAGSGFKALKLKSAANIQTGEQVYSIGSPLGLDDTMSSGIITNTNRVANGLNFIQTNAGLNKGSSGSPLFNDQGAVIGIVTGSFDMVSLNLALKTDYILNYSKSALKTLLAIKVNANSKISAYAAYPDFPDFGAYYGLTPRASVSNGAGMTYYYLLSEAKAIDAWNGDPDAELAYLNMLVEWGFQYQAGFYVGEDYLWEFNLTSYHVTVGTIDYAGSKCVYVQVMKG